MSMTHERKLQKMYAHLPALGISPYTAAPPIYRMLWHVGIEIPPPIFGSFVPTAVFTGALFAIGWAAAMWLLPGAQEPETTLASAATTAGVAGVMFGLIMAGYYSWKSKQLKLPPWSEYTGQA